MILAYLLAVTSLIVSAGRLGDILGRRRLQLFGIALFTVASLLCGVAPTLWLLVAARAAQGLGAAVMMAPTMALVGESVPSERIRNVMGLLGTMSAIGTTLGPSLGVVSGMLGLSRNLGLITGASLMGAIFAFASATANITTASPSAVAAGMRTTLTVAALLIVVSLAIAMASWPRTSRSQRRKASVEAPVLVHARRQGR